MKKKYQKMNNLQLVTEIESPEFTTNTVLFVNENRLKTESYLDENVSNDHIRVAVLHIQSEIITRVLGTCLTDQLKELICTGHIDDNKYRWYKELLDSYLYPIFSYGVQAELPIPLGFKNKNQGMVQPQGEDFSQTNLSDIQYISKWYRNHMDFYMKKAIDWLTCNRKQFSELCKTGCCNCVESPLNKDYDTGLSLGNTCKTKRYGRF